MSICALLSGVALIIFYALILGVYINRGYYCYYADDSLCKCTRSLFMVIRFSIH
jgi:hypothetical protein